MLRKMRAMVPPAVVWWAGWMLLLTRMVRAAEAAAAAVVDADGSVVVEEALSYGTGCSWPTRDSSVLSCPGNPLGARQSLYEEYLSGCEASLSPSETGECARWESDRIEMNRRQPAASQNYTYAGFARVEAPPGALGLLKGLWERHASSSGGNDLPGVPEAWEAGNTYVNHWESPTRIVDLGHPRNGLSRADQWELVRAVQEILEAWTGRALVLTSLYGIRVYPNGAILAPHVDRLPLVTSAILPVATDLDQPWPLEVVGHDGIARNVTASPGEMILYESHSVLHGRPFPLRGRYAASVFVHFEPIGHSAHHAKTHGADDGAEEDAKAAYERAYALRKQAEQQQQQQAATGAPAPTLPRYVPNEHAGRWQQQFEFDKEGTVGPKPTRTTLGAINPHFAAADGQLDLLKELAATDRAKLFAKDHNGWRPLHEAARGGRAETVRYLLDEGAVVNERTNDGDGGTPLWWAEKHPKKNAATIAILKEHGAVAVPPKPPGTTVKLKKKIPADANHHNNKNNKIKPEEQA